MYRNLLGASVFVTMQIATLSAQAVTLCTAGNPNPNKAESTPSSAFVNNGDGTITHTLTGLMWKQCVQGLTGSSCAIGTAANMEWKAALAAAAAENTAGYSDWRLPNSKELESIVEFCGYTPSINRTFFPATPADSSWTGSTFAPTPSSAWAVDFYEGATKGYAKTLNFKVRLVRGGQSFDSYDAQGDSVPSALAFATQNGVARATLVTSNAVTVAGINTVAPISVVNGSYAINGGTFTTSGGGVRNGDSVVLQVTSSANYSTGTSAVLTIGGISGAFNVVTEGGGSNVLTVTKDGVGGGVVSSAPQYGIDCGLDCTEPFVSPTSVVLTPAANPGSLFGGWSGACIGTGACNVNVVGSTSVNATFMVVMDVDGNGKVDALTDGLLMIRYMFGLRGTALVSNATAADATRTAAQIEQYLQSVTPH